MTVDIMRNFIVQSAYTFERQVRTMAQGLNNFGTVYDSQKPMMEQRMFFMKMTQEINEGLHNLEKLGAKFQIGSLEKLIGMEPDPAALQIANTFAEVISHADDVSEFVAPLAVVMQRHNDINQRMKKALQTNPAYKAWALSDDDLAFFDIWMHIDPATMKNAVTHIVGRSLRRDLTLCPLRRRLNQINHAQLEFFNAVQKGPYRPVGRIGFGF